MMNNRFVYFDLGNVLVTFDHEVGIQQLAALANRPPKLVRSTIFDGDLQTRFETGLISADEFVTEVNLQLETSIPKRDVLEAISAIFEPNLPILAALEKVKRANVPMGILSNTCDAHWLWLKERQWPMLGDWFQTTVLSYEIHGMKPHPSIYEASEKQAGCTGETIFFTDDRADNIAAASERGWTTHRFKAVDELLVSLDQWLTQTANNLSAV